MLIIHIHVYASTAKITAIFQLFKSFVNIIYRQLGASLQTIEVESRKLEELKAIVFQDFRREMLNKLKKQSESRVSYTVHVYWVDLTRGKIYLHVSKFRSLVFI